MKSIDMEVIETFEQLARDRIARELDIRLRVDTETGDYFLIASMPALSETKVNKPAFKVVGIQTDIEIRYITDKVFDYFYSQIFDYMKTALAKES